MPRNKIKVNETLNDFLFNQIENDPEFVEFVENYEIPEYITSNISRTLRPYQELALKHFIYLFEKDPKTATSDLYPLDSFSVRKDENIQKGYINGRYGAIPFIRDIDLWLEDN